MALSTNLLSYYKLDSNSSDSLGSLNGTDTSVSYVAGKIGNAASFGGASKIDFSTTGYNLGAAFTINMWINVTNTTVRQGLFCKTDGLSNTTSSFICEVGNPSSKLTFTVAAGSGSATVSSGSALSNSTWYMVTFTYDGTNLTIFLNGTSDGTNATGIGAVNTITQGTTLGYFGAYALLPYTGLIDAVGVWTRVLSGSEITQLYNAGAGLDYPFGASTSPTSLLLGV